MIKANFNAYSNYVTDSLYQWDLNQVLTVHGLNLSSAPEVHFSNVCMDKAIVRQATMTNHVVSVDIPNSMLQDPLTINAHIGIYEGATFKVVELVQIPVIPKERPSDYRIQNTDEEIYSFEALRNELVNKATKAETNAINARIDTIVANANSTAGNSELVDLRVDAYGATYVNAGAAARKWQTKIANSHITDIGFIYSGYSGNVEFTPVADGALRVDLPNKLTLIAPENNGGAIAWENSCSDISNYIVINDDNSAILTIPYRACFVYNVTDKLYHIRPISYVTQGDIIAVNNLYQSPVSGSLVLENLWKETGKFNEFIKKLSSPISIPDKIKTFSALFNNASTIESFLFFTDPHTKRGIDWADKTAKHIENIKTIYDMSPVDFCVSGGDWLNDSDTQVEACSALAFIDSQMRKSFDKYYMIMGNHDTNYQGILETNSAANTGRLTVDTINNLWFRKNGKAYYSFNGRNTTFFIFDTGIDWNSSFDNYSLEQAVWFAECLKNSSHEHIAIGGHMLHVSSTDDFSPLMDKICEISKAFNDRSTIVINGVTYDFDKAVGKIEFLFAGHSHADLTGTLHDIPYFITTMSASGYDLVLVDYTARNINLVRIGNGTDRVINL